MNDIAVRVAAVHWNPSPAFCASVDQTLVERMVAGAAASIAPDRERSRQLLQHLLKRIGNA